MTLKHWFLCNFKSNINRFFLHFDVMFIGEMAKRKAESASGIVLILINALPVKEPLDNISGHIYQQLFYNHTMQFSTIAFHTMATVSLSLYQLLIYIKKCHVQNVFSVYFFTMHQLWISKQNDFSSQIPAFNTTNHHILICIHMFRLH